jgi:hypothetical protein
VKKLIAKTIHQPLATSNQGFSPVRRVLAVGCIAVLAVGDQSALAHGSIEPIGRPLMTC